MRITLTLFLTILVSAAFGQKIGYLNKNFIPVSFKDKATYYTETTKSSDIAGIVKTYLLDGTLVTEESFSNVRAKTRDGISKSYYRNGFLKSEINYKNGNYSGALKTYYPNHRLKRAEFYENGKLVAGKCLNTAGFDTTYYDFQVSPSFPGGEAALYKYLENNSRYPITLVDYIQSQQLFKNYVVVKFVVGTSGAVSDVLISVPLSTMYDREVMRIISEMPKWLPGTEDGEAVSREITMPIGFR